jgi:hypothetical protein
MLTQLTVVVLQAVPSCKKVAIMPTQAKMLKLIQLLLEFSKSRTKIMDTWKLYASSAQMLQVARSCINRGGFNSA